MTEAKIHTTETTIEKGERVLTAVRAGRSRKSTHAGFLTCVSVREDYRGDKSYSFNYGQSPLCGARSAGTHYAYTTIERVSCPRCLAALEELETGAKREAAKAEQAKREAKRDTRPRAERVADLPALSRRVYDFVAGECDPADPCFTTVTGDEIAKVLGISQKSLSGVAARLGDLIVVEYTHVNGTPVVFWGMPSDWEG